MAQLGTRVTVEELAAMFGVQQTTDAIFSESVLNDNNPNFNKWSKRKPINHSLSGPLTDAQMKGLSTDVAKGIIYGLKAGVARTSPANLHTATWDYVGRPQGGTSSWYRVDDFWRYEKDITYPTLSGTGLYTNQKIQVGSNGASVQLVWNLGATSVVDLAEVFAAYTNQAPNYGDMYLCALVGSRARALVNADAGGVYPIYYNNTYSKNFTIPSTSSFIGADTTHPVTLFFANGVDINTAVNGVKMKDGWADFSLAPAFTALLVSVPNQVNISVQFVMTVIQYITAFSIKYDSRGKSFTFNITKGNDWNKANAYRVRMTVKKAGESTEHPATYIDIPKDSLMLGTGVSTIMNNAGIVQDGKAANYVFTAIFTAQASAGGGYSDTTFTDTLTINLTSW
jgi:hypothetical protein